MKMRVWAGKPTLATEQGKELPNFEAFAKWLEKQPDGQIEVWAGRWWVVSKETVPFTVTDGKAHCSHPSFKSQQKHDTKDFPGFFAFEAWKRAMKLHDFWHGIGQMSNDMVKGISDD